MLKLESTAGFVGLRCQSPALQCLVRERGSSRQRRGPGHLVHHRRRVVRYGNAGKNDEKSDSGFVATTLFLGSTLATAALFDAAYSGDWSRIGAITSSTEDILKAVCKVVTAERMLLAVLIYTKREELDQVPWTLVKAVLGGTSSVYSKIFSK